MDADTSTGSTAGQKGIQQQNKNVHTAQLAQQMLEIWTYLKRARYKYELEAYINENYYRSEHYLRYDLVSSKVEVIPFAKLGARIAINRIKEKVTQAVSFLTKDEPRFDVEPAGGQQSDEVKQRIDAERSWADYIYSRLEIDRKLEEIALEGAKFSTGWFKIGYNPSTRVIMADGSDLFGEVFVEVAPWWHVYTDPIARYLGQQRFMAFAEPRTIGELKLKYPNGKLLTPDRKFTPSEYEQRIMNQLWKWAPSGDQPSKEETGTVVVIELYYWKWVRDAKAGTDSDGQAHMDKQLWVCTMTQDGLILDHKQHPWGNWFPFEPFQWDAASGTIYTEGLIKQIRQPNKALNRLVTGLVEYTDIFKGKILEPRTANVTTITDENGERIQYDITGGKPEYWQVPPINPSVNTAIEYLERKIDDLSMIHSQFAGGTGYPGESGYHAEIMAQGDAQNFMTTKNNLTRCLENTFKKALMIAAQEYKKQGVTRDLAFNDRRFQISGQDLNLDDDIRVMTQAGFAFTKQYELEELKNLYQLQVIDRQTLLEAYRFTDLENILQRTEEQQNGAPLDNDTALAEMENRQIAQGQMPQPKPGFDPQTHLILHGRFAKSQVVAQNPMLKKMLVQLMQQEEQLASQQAQQDSQQPTSALVDPQTHAQDLQQQQGDQQAQVQDQVQAAQEQAQQQAQQEAAMKAAEMQHEHEMQIEELNAKHQLEMSKLQTPKPPAMTMSFDDLPPMGKVQAAAMLGIQLDPKDPFLKPQAMAPKPAAKPAQSVKKSTVTKK